MVKKYIYQKLQRKITPCPYTKYGCDQEFLLPLGKCLQNHQEKCHFKKYIHQPSDDDDDDCTESDNSSVEEDVPPPPKKKKRRVVPQKTRKKSKAKQSCSHTQQPIELSLPLIQSSSFLDAYHQNDLFIDSLPPPYSNYSNTNNNTVVNNYLTLNNYGTTTIVNGGSSSGNQEQPLFIVSDEDVDPILFTNLEDNTTNSFLLDDQEQHWNTKEAQRRDEQETIHLYDQYTNVPNHLKSYHHYLDSLNLSLEQFIVEIKHKNNKDKQGIYESLQTSSEATQKLFETTKSQLDLFQCEQQSMENILDKIQEDMMWNTI